MAEAIAELKTMLQDIGDKSSERYKAIDEKIQQLEADLKETRYQFKNRKADLPGVDEQKEKFSFHYAVKYAAHGESVLPKDDPNAAFTVSVIKEATQKVMSEGVDTAGGYVVPNQYIPTIIEVLRANMVATQLGATMLNNLQGSPVEIPRQTTAATASWTAENSAITASDLAFGQVNLKPHELGALVKMSRRSAVLSNPALEQLTMTDIGEQFGRALDLAILKGTGADSQPLGILNQPSVSTSTSIGTIAYGDLVDLMGVVEDGDALKGSLGWAMHPATKRRIMKVVDGNSRPIFNWDVSTSATGVSLTPTILTYPFATTTQLVGTTGSAELFFGNWADVLVGEWGTMLLEPSTQASTAFESHQLWVKGIMEVDVGLRHAESFAISTDVAD